MAPASARTHVRPRSRRGEGDKLRDEILDAAEVLLKEMGDSDAVSIRMITDEVGCTAPSIYRHFHDKATLIYAVCDRLFMQLHAALTERSRDIDDPVEALRLAGHAYLDFGIENPEAYRVMFLTSGEEIGDVAEYVPQTLQDAAATDPAFGTLVEMVRRVADTGAFRIDDPLRVSVDLWTLVHGVTVHAVVANRYFPYPDHHEELDRLMELCLRGLAPD